MENEYKYFLILKEYLSTINTNGANKKIYVKLLENPYKIEETNIPKKNTTK